MVRLGCPPAIVFPVTDRLVQDANSCVARSPARLEWCYLLLPSRLFILTPDGSFP